MKREGTMWRGTVNAHTNIFVNVVGTYGDDKVPIVRVENGPDKAKAFAIDWQTGKVIKQLNLK